MSTFLASVFSARRGAARPSRAAVVALAAAILGCAVIPAATAQTWPQRNVRFILPFGAGSATDIAARLIGERVATKWGRAVVVENRPGGDGLLAINAFTSANDEHVLLFSSSASFLSHPYTQDKLPYDLERDLAPIVRVSDTVLSVTVPGTSSFRSVADFVNAARALPEKHNAVGAAGIPELTVDAFLKSEKLGISKVPYKDIMQAAPDLGENRIQFLLASVAVTRPLVESGKVRIIAIAARQRSPLFKDIPSVVEAGFPGLVVETTSGVYGPKGMPLDLRRRVAADVIAVLKDPTVAEKISSSGQDIRPGGPEELAETLRQQMANTAAVAKILGMARK